MQTWNIRAEMTGAPTDDQQEAIAEEATISHFNTSAEHVEVSLTIQAADHLAALTAAKQALTKMRATQALIDAGVLTGAHRITIENSQAREASVPFVSTKAFAELLGVSDARIRQLKGGLGFPEPFTIPGAAGEFYHRSDVDTYLPHHSSRAGGAGKPRAGDEELLNDGLRLLATHADLTDVQQVQVARAIEATGGRYLRGKAMRLAELSRRPPGSKDPRRKMSTSDADRYGAAVVRADELWQP